MDIIIKHTHPVAIPGMAGDGFDTKVVFFWHDFY